MLLVHPYIGGEYSPEIAKSEIRELNSCIIGTSIHLQAIRWPVSKPTLREIPLQVVTTEQLIDDPDLLCLSVDATRRSIPVPVYSITYVDVTSKIYAIGDLLLTKGSMVYVPCENDSFAASFICIEDLVGYDIPTTPIDDTVAPKLHRVRCLGKNTLRGCRIALWHRPGFVTPPIANVVSTDIIIG